jgi:hypothetical protein
MKLQGFGGRNWGGRRRRRGDNEWRAGAAHALSRSPAPRARVQPPVASRSSQVLRRQAVSQLLRARFIGQTVYYDGCAYCSNLTSSLLSLTLHTFSSWYSSKHASMSFCL